MGHRWEPQGPWTEARDAQGQPVKPSDWLRENERKLTGARSSRREARKTITATSKRSAAAARLLAFCLSLPESGIVTKHTRRLSVRERAQYQRDGLWPMQSPEPAHAH